MVTDATDRVFSDLAVPPGELLAEELDARGMSQKELAVRTGRPEQKISEIINGKKSITHDTSLELEKVLGISADFWVRLENSYQLALARQRERQELEKQEDWLDFFPVKELRRRGYIPKTSDKKDTLAGLLTFFGVASFQALRQRQESILQEYRITPKATVSDGALWAWLRAGTLKAREGETEPYSDTRFRQALAEIRPLTRQPLRGAAARAAGLCAGAGVALVVVKEFPRGGANGVSRWLSPDRAMIQLSTKWRWTDIFWFSFFHEAKHILNGKKRRALVKGINIEQEVESDADRFAANTLIPRGEWQTFVASGHRSARHVVEFATRIGIEPGIVIGRMQHEHLIGHDRLNYLRRKIVWSDEQGGDSKE